jgi:hypothetical protein
MAVPRRVIGEDGRPRFDLSSLFERSEVGMHES